LAVKIPKAKSQIPNKFQLENNKTEVWSLVIKHYLAFGNWTFPKCSSPSGN
jgi:hypothetical protein